MVFLLRMGYCRLTAIILILQAMNGCQCSSYHDRINGYPVLMSAIDIVHSCYLDSPLLSSNYDQINVYLALML